MIIREYPEINSMPACVHVVKAAGIKYSVFLGINDDKIHYIFAFRGDATQGQGFLNTDNKNTAVGYIAEEGARQRIISDKMSGTEVLIADLVCATLKRGFIINDVIDILKTTKGEQKHFCSVLIKALSKHQLKGERK
jgi:hypothetical protein